MKPRDPNRSDSARVMEMSSADEVTELSIADEVAELSIADDGTAEIVNPTCVFPTVGAN